MIGHRGASGYLPEHTLAAYQLAIEQCADFIEPDLVSTQDGVLVARHENEISGTTDMAQHPEFANRYTTKVIDGASVSGWFTEDFTLAELKTLRAEERIPEVRPQNAAYDGDFSIPTLQEVIDLARSSRTCDGNVVGIYPETKHPSYFDSGLSMEEELVRLLHTDHYRGQRAAVFIQSFEVSNLRDLAGMTQLPLAQLINRSGLLVHGWTFRRENRFLPADYRRGVDPDAPGDMVGEVRAFLAAGMDGFFTDHPDLGASAAELFGS